MQSLQNYRFQDWKEENGDESFRLNYELTQDSVVFDLGGYKGDWTQKIFNLYRCTIYIFEPVQEYYNEIVDRFKDNSSSIKPFCFGLGSQSMKTQIRVDNDASAISEQADANHIKIEIKSFVEFVNQFSIKKIHLMKINIEGSEYDLLDELLNNNCIQMIDNIQVQFHDFFPNAKERMNSIRERLSHTHFLTYSFPFIWENWSLKASSTQDNSKSAETFFQTRYEKIYTQLMQERLLHSQTKLNLQNAEQRENTLLNSSAYKIGLKLTSNYTASMLLKLLHYASRLQKRIWSF